MRPRPIGQDVQQRLICLVFYWINGICYNSRHADILTLTFSVIKEKAIIINPDNMEHNKINLSDFSVVLFYRFLLHVLNSDSITGNEVNLRNDYGL